MTGDVTDRRPPNTPPRRPNDGSVIISREQLERLQRLSSVGAVSSSVAHEFNNILTAILNHAKMGTRSTDLDAARTSFEKILTSARRAARITTGVLALSRQRGATREPTRLVPLVEEILAVLEKDLQKHQVRLEKRFEDDPSADVVAAQIEQVVMNLVINARQAMPSGGTIVLGIKANASAGMAEISVKDTGVGIPADKLPRIFDPFFTTKNGPDDSGHGGSGLGLSVCREIIGRHDGRIRVESLVGKGTTFTIKLPLSSAAPSQAA